MPTRYLKPGICDSDTIDKCSPLAECLFYRLLVNVDDYGRLDARPAVVRSKCFPLKDTFTNKFTEELLQELHSVGLIILYEIDACMFLQLSKWDNVPRSKESKYPAPVDGVRANVCNQRTVLPVTETVTGTETSTLSDKSDVAQEKPNTKKLAQAKEAQEVLAYLNAVVGSRFEPVAANVQLITARISEGATMETLKMVVDRKHREWANDSAMSKYLRPATLFNATKFAQYAGEVSAHQPAKSSEWDAATRGRAFLWEKSGLPMEEFKP